jgi:hypothetical protein
MAKVAECRSCHAAVIWVATEATETKPSRRMPVDADPTRPGKALVVENGNLVFTGQQDGTSGSWIVRYVPSGRGKHLSHFATCPNATQHRKGKR